MAVDAFRSGVGSWGVQPGLSLFQPAFGTTEKTLTVLQTGRDLMGAKHKAQAVMVAISGIMCWLML